MNATGMHVQHAYQYGPVRRTGGRAVYASTVQCALLGAGLCMPVRSSAPYWRQGCVCQYGPVRRTGGRAVYASAVQCAVLEAGRCMPVRSSAPYWRQGCVCQYGPVRRTVGTCWNIKHVAALLLEHVGTGKK